MNEESLKPYFGRIEFSGRMSSLISFLYRLELANTLQVIHFWIVAQSCSLYILLSSLQYAVSDAHTHTHTTQSVCVCVCVPRRVQ